jgi:hypothetical protein
MSASWIRLRKLTDDFLLDHHPDVHLLTQELQVATIAWARDLDEMVRLRAELAEARAALQHADRLLVPPYLSFLGAAEFNEKHASALKAAREDKP